MTVEKDTEILKRLNKTKEERKPDLREEREERDRQERLEKKRKQQEEVKISAVINSTIIIVIFTEIKRKRRS